MNAPEPERLAAADDGRRALARVVAAVHQRWGAGSLTYREAIVPDPTRSSPFPQTWGSPCTPKAFVTPVPGPYPCPDPPTEATRRTATGAVHGPGHPSPVATGEGVPTRHGANTTSYGGAAQRRSPVRLPPWWPGATARDGRPLPVPPILEVGVATGAGRLTFMLAWAAALRPDLLAIIDGSPVEDGARLYPPAVVVAGLPSTCQPIVVRPGGTLPSPQGTPREVTRAIVDALFILLRSEAFDAILCPMPVGARLTTATATTLASMAARAGTALVVVTGSGAVARGASPRALLGPSAAYRLVIADHRWAWRDGELAGLRLEVHTHRARGGAEASLSHGDAPARLGSRNQALATHVLDFRLRRTMRDGPAPDATGMGIDGTSWELSGVAVGGLAEREGDATADTFLASAV